jgi:hypothetical protein
MPPPPWKGGRRQNRVFWTRYPAQSGQFARARIRQGAEPLQVVPRTPVDMTNITMQNQNHRIASASAS